MQAKRRRARQAAVQAIYQWQLAGHDVGEIEEQFLTEQDTTRFDIDYFRELLHGVPAHLGELDQQLGPLLDRVVEQVDPVERAALRLGAYELMFHPEVPFRVAINEAVELAKRFGAAEGHKYVNGVLDRLAQRVRRPETRSPPRS
jgi:N utilization substance protein B